MQFVNLTGHEVYNLSSGLRLPAGDKLRVLTSTTKQLIAGQVVHETHIVEGELPEPKEDTIYIISALAMAIVPSDRKDVWCPKRVIRDNSGNIIGCKDFRRKE